MVEGGTLLRCYTSKRGIEGSNPSSSAPEVALFGANTGASRKAGVSPGLFNAAFYVGAAFYPSHEEPGAVVSG